MLELGQYTSQRAWLLRFPLCFILAGQLAKLRLVSALSDLTAGSYSEQPTGMCGVLLHCPGRLAMLGHAHIHVQLLNSVSQTKGLQLPGSVGRCFTAPADWPCSHPFPALEPGQPDQEGGAAWISVTGFAAMGVCCQVTAARRSGWGMYLLAGPVCTSLKIEDRRSRTWAISGPLCTPAGPAQGT